LDVFPYLEHIDNIADSESQPPPPLVPPIEIYPGAGGLLSNYIAEPWGWDTHGCQEMNLQNNPYHPFVTCEEYNDIQGWIKQKGMKT
jgi:hypothetical protein